MAEYIEREALIKELCNSCDGWCDKVDCDCVNCKSEHRCDPVVEIADAPAADVVEVRHGKWVEERCNHKPYRLNNPEKWVKYKCSECGYSNGRKHSNYCPNCGAKMDGKDKE